MPRKPRPEAVSEVAAAAIARMHLGGGKPVQVVAETAWAGKEATVMTRTECLQRVLPALGLLVAMVALGAAAASQTQPWGTLAASAAQRSEEGSVWMTVGERRFGVTLDDNETVRALAQLLPLTLDMIELNRNEKYAELPQALPTNANRPGTIRAGDLMLFGPRTLVVFYETFESSYAYTRIGRIDNPADLKRALGPGDVRVRFARQP